MSTRRLPAPVVALLVGLVGVVGLVCVPTTNGALTGRVTNSTNTAATAVFATSCQAAVRSTGAYAAYAFAEANGLGGAVDATTNNRNGSYALTGVTYAQPGPCPRDSARSVTLNGSSGAVLGPTMTNPQTFSVQLWFRTTTTAGGRLVGFGNGALLATASTSYDRHVYMTNDGRLTFGVYPNALRTVSTTAAYNDGAWHHVVGTLAPSGATQGLRLYVDGQLVGSDPATTGAQVYNGSWRFGFDSLDTWPGQPTSRYFAGGIAYGAIWASALTPAQVTSLYQAGR